MTLILASGSASRRAMLDAAGVDYVVMPAHVDEGAIKADLLAKGAPPSNIAGALAAAKALSVAQEQPGSWVLGGDSVVHVGGKIFDKPVSKDDAAAHLRAFSGKTITLLSAAVLAKDGRVVESVVDEAKLSVRALSESFIADYLAAEWPAVAGCVGCFRMEARGVQLFEAVEGNHFTILGMPLLWVLAALRRAKAIAL